MRNKNLGEIKNSFLRLLQSEFKVEKIGRKLEGWFELDFLDFSKEIEKRIKPQKVSLSKKSEWMGYFEKEKTIALALRNERDLVNNKIDQAVYELYDLTAEEIELIESNNN